MVDDPDTPIKGFDWFPAKRSRILRERGIDFVDAAKVLLGEVYAYPSNREGEQRFVAIGPLINGTLIAVVYTIRGSTIRIITARKARTNEQRAYLHHRATSSIERTD